MAKIIKLKFDTTEIENIGLILTKGATHWIFKFPVEITGRGINICPDPDNNGWFQYMVTVRAFEQIRKEYPMIQQVYEANENYELAERLNKRKKRMKK